ncbi:GGDEF domain-containing response regulator [Oryzibacter oryziterrae]|uniref:GGDEF domain-containing response regulator n=1 Tax=Oryzibacter oryziterrae TaxID=2766474 RepID=UPI001F00C297|nr:diguanylate cyclase [Oryzibacter oryziterrae]
MHIVLVDGSRTGLMIIKRMLDPRGDDVAYFTDGREALDYIRSTPQADLLITSFEIGGISGTELCWEARVIADSGRPFYVIAMSSSNDTEHSISVLDAGADDFMSKPPHPDELNARLRVAERTLTMQRRLIEMATIDTLSGLLNRRAFRAKFDEVVEILPSDGCLSMILFDIDHFKRINDVFGHDAGDDVIRAIGKLHVPPDTIFARIGGEEFAVVMPDIPLDGAASVADYLREQIAALEVPYQDKIITLTASFGVSEYRAGETHADLYRRADSALYHSKNSGRNRVSKLSPVLVAE